MKNRNLIVSIALAVMLIIGINSVRYAFANNMKTYDGTDTDVQALYNDPTDYDVSEADGIADIIVKENLEKTMAANNVAAIVFDFRGFDTLGESFILLTAIAGSYVILGKHTKKTEKEEEK